MKKGINKPTTSFCPLTTYSLKKKGLINLLALSSQAIWYALKPGQTHLILWKSRRDFWWVAKHKKAPGVPSERFVLCNHPVLPINGTYSTSQPAYYSIHLDAFALVLKSSFVSMTCYLSNRNRRNMHIAIIKKRLYDKPLSLFCRIVLPNAKVCDAREVL